MKKTVEERFWSHVGPHSDINVCWLWLGFSAPNRGSGKALVYGRVKVCGVVKYAHRHAYELLVGPIPNGLTIDHVKARGCTSTLCVNPMHLEAVPNKINILRGSSPAALHAVVTCCPKGHVYDAGNTGHRKNGARYCRKCDCARKAKNAHLL